MVPRASSWLIALISGSVIGLGLRLGFFLVGVSIVKIAGTLLAKLVPIAPALDPVYTLAAAHSLADLNLQGLAVVGPAGAWLHGIAPDLFAPAERAHWAFVRLAVEPGSPIMGRLVASGFAHAAVLSAGLLAVRRGWRHHSAPIVLAGIAMQLQVALGILGAQPSIRELESTGISFALNALLPTLAPRNAALTDVPAMAWPPVVSAALVALALLVGYLPFTLLLLLRDRARRITLGTAALVLVGSAACAGVLTEETPGPVPVAVQGLPSSSVQTLSAGSAASLSTLGANTQAANPTSQAVMLDRWFDQQSAAAAAAGPSHVAIVSTGDFQYQYVVNGSPQVIKGMGLNTQYASQLSPADRATRIDADMAELSALGVNTVLGWDPAEFDQVLLDAAQRHGIGVVVPFGLDPDADYTDPAVRQTLHDQALARVAQYRNHPAVRMWGLGNEVLHKIVHPAWVGPQDPQQERDAEAFSDWLIWTADDIHALDPDHPVTYRSAEDAFVQWVIDALDRRGGGPRPWFVWGTNCYQAHLSDIVDEWPTLGMRTALWVSEFAPGAQEVDDRPDGFATMWGYVRRHSDYVLGGAVYAWTRNGPEGVDRDFGLTDDGTPVDGGSLDMLRSLFHSD